MAASEQPSITVGEKMGGLDSPSSPDPPHASTDPDHELENSLSEELLRLVLKESSEAAQLQAEDDGGPGGGEEIGTSNNHGTDYNYSGWDDDDKEGVGVGVGYSGWDDDDKEGVGVGAGVGAGAGAGAGAGEVDDVGDGRESDREERGTGFVRNLFPVRPGAEDCAYYIKTGTCKFGSMCKFNHPVRGRAHAAREWIRDKEEMVDKPGLIECKYYLRTGGCRYGKACKYSHPRTQEQPLNHPRANPSVAPVMELNFLGLPIRPGEKDCPYYMRNGSCKYAASCRFNHPDPTASGEGGGGDLAGYGNGPSVSSKGPPQPVASWSASMRTLNETAPFAPAVYSPPMGGIAHHKAEWNIYQVPTYSPERSVLPPQPYMRKNPGNETAAYANSKQQMIIDEFPERPGQPECTFFLKTGDCKFKSNCKYHHPKNRIPSSSSVPLSDKGLPLRPDQNVCSYYSRYGICKFGPACRFDHPVNWTPSNLSAPFSSFAGPDGSGMVRTGSVGNVAIEQSL